MIKSIKSPLFYVEYGCAQRNLTPAGRVCEGKKHPVSAGAWYTPDRSPLLEIPPESVTTGRTGGMRKAPERGRLVQVNVPFAKVFGVHPGEARDSISGVLLRTATLPIREADGSQ